MSGLYGDGKMYNMTLPSGELFPLRVDYTGREDAGVIALVVASSISALAVFGLLGAIAVSAYHTRGAAPNARLFVRTHVAAYFISLLFCDILQAVGSIMSTKWVIEHNVYFGTYCQIQGGIKQASDVGQAIWTLIVAIHTFNVLFLRLMVPRPVMWATLVGGWALVATIVLGGPATLDTRRDGPFFGISGYWCWITAGHPVQRVTLDYLMMFSSAVLCFILYALTFLRLRGHITSDGGRLRFHLRVSNRQSSASDDQHFARVIAKRMLLYPIAYTALLVPIGVARFVSWSGHDVPFEWTIFSDFIFLLSGFVDVCLFCTTRSLLPRRPHLAASHEFSRPASTVASSDSGAAGKGDWYASTESLSPPTAPPLSAVVLTPVFFAPPVPERRDDLKLDDVDMA